MGSTTHSARFKVQGWVFICPVQIENLEVELKEVTERHEKLKKELEEGSQDPGVKLVASQLAEYKKLKNDAEKKSANLKQRLDRVREERGEI